MDRRAYLGTIGGLALVSLAGCASDETATETTGPGGTTETTSPGGTTETATPTASPTETATSTGASVGQQTFPDYNWELLADSTAKFTTEVTLRDQSFHPVVATVPMGSVRFVNEDSYEHTVTIPAIDVKKTLGGGDSVEVTVDSTGRYDYVCELHPPSMLGRLRVVDETPTGTPTESPTATPTGTPTPTPTGTETDSGYY